MPRGTMLVIEQIRNVQRQPLEFGVEIGGGRFIVFMKAANGGGYWSECALEESFVQPFRDREMARGVVIRGKVGFELSEFHEAGVPGARIVLEGPNGYWQGFASIAAADEHVRLNERRFMPAAGGAPESEGEPPQGIYRFNRLPKSDATTVRVQVDGPMGREDVTVARTDEGIVIPKTGLLPDEVVEAILEMAPGYLLP